MKPYLPLILLAGTFLGCAPSTPPPTYIPAAGNVKPGVTIYCCSPEEARPLGKVLEIVPNYQEPGKPPYDAFKFQRVDGQVIYNPRSMLEGGSAWLVRSDDPALR